MPESWRLGPELPESVYDINDENVLLGFKSGIDWSKYENSCDTMQIPARVTSINADAFYRNQATSIQPFIKNLTFADGSQCSSIGGYAFYKCSSLTSVVFPSSLTEITGQYAFSQCTALTSVDLSNCSNMTSIYVHAFSRCSSLSTVKFPPNLIEIESFAFYDNDSLATINLPRTFRTFENYSFRNTGLTSLDLSNTSLTKIGTYSFSDNPRLTSVTLPKSLTYVNTWTFNDCPLLNHIAWNITTNFQSYEIFEDGDIFNKISETGTIESLNPSVSSTQLLEFFKSKLTWISNHNDWTAAS